MHFLTQSLITITLLTSAVVSIPSPQGVPPQGGGGGVQGTCYWHCCEEADNPYGTLCRPNEAPYPYGVDCYPALDAANMTCCHLQNCTDQTAMPQPVRVS